MLGISWFKTIYLYIRIIVGKLKLNPGGKNKQNVNNLSQQVKWLHVESDKTLFINYFFIYLKKKSLLRCNKGQLYFILN